jgi:predicted outer membrane lipoprotein
MVPFIIGNLAVTLAAAFAVLARLELLKPLWRKQLKA